MTCCLFHFFTVPWDQLEVSPETVEGENLLLLLFPLLRLTLVSDGWALGRMWIRFQTFL